MADQSTPATAGTAPSFDAAAYTSLGTARERVALPAELFDGTVNMGVMHLAVKAYLANQRQANASTKTRGLVIGGNQKPWKQKGTGRARQGSTRAPQWPGGGTVFGPHGDRNYTQDLPKKVKALARRSAFNARAKEGAIYVIDAFNYAEPRTRTLKAMLDRVGVGDQKVLILTDGVKTNVHLSGRNIGTVRVLPYSDASAYHVLWSDVVLIEGPAVGHTLAPIAEAEPERAPRAKANVKAKAAAKAAPKPNAKRVAKVAKKEAKAAKAAKRTAKSAKTTAAKSAKKSAASKAKPRSKKAAKPAAKKSAAKKTSKKKGE